MNKIWENIKPYENILILGFGKEGQSTYSYIRLNDEDRKITIADKNSEIRNYKICEGDNNLDFILGDNYLENLEDFDLIIKAPGLPLRAELISKFGDKLTSQADLFLREYSSQTIGITGSKGKSTTTTFIHHFLTLSNVDALLVGNIGLPPFDVEGRIKESTVIVYELSSHMLQGVRTSPHIAVLLNIFKEHLDYYKDMDSYTLAKAQIFVHQKSDDILIMSDDKGALELVNKYSPKSHIINWDSIPEKDFLFVPQAFAEIPNPIRGDHIKHNLIFGAVAACYMGADSALLLLAFDTFESLPHRLQILGEFNGITFVNDSISTIPEATLAALTAYPETNILIVGGQYRNVPFDNLVEKLSQMPDLFIFCIDQSGKIIFDALHNIREDSIHYKYFENLELATEACFETLGDMGGTVVLSPAAASFTQFKNFEERGEAFLEYIRKFSV